MATITLTIYWLRFFFTRRRNGHIKNSHHCWTESLVDLQEDQLIPQYYYVSTSNKHVNNINKIFVLDLCRCKYFDQVHLITLVTQHSKV